MTDLDVGTRKLRVARLLGATSLIAGALIAAAPALAQDAGANLPATSPQGAEGDGVPNAEDSAANNDPANTQPQAD